MDMLGQMAFQNLVEHKSILPARKDNKEKEDGKKSIKRDKLKKAKLRQLHTNKP
jgi:hypothetical protein